MTDMMSHAIPEASGSPDSLELRSNCHLTGSQLGRPGRSPESPILNEGGETVEPAGTPDPAWLRFRSEADQSADPLTVSRRPNRPGILVLTDEQEQSVAVEVPESSGRHRGLTGADVTNLNSVFEHEVAETTKLNYRVQWRRFTNWALGRGVTALPADPVQVATYLAERLERDGHRPATLRAACSAISFVHRNAELDDPCAEPEVRRTLKSATRKAGSFQKQADALTAEAFTVIETTAYTPRRGRGGRLETPESARRRGCLDMAMMSLMRDGMLRLSETSALTWADIRAEPDGTGRLLIRRSKTDQKGEGSVAFVSVPTMVLLDLIREGAADTDSVFALRPNQISKRIKLAAEAAGLGRGFSGHSPRVGMARDLVRAGIELPSLMTAGRWRSPNMPALYTRNEIAGRGAVAQYYSYRR